MSRYKKIATIYLCAMINVKCKICVKNKNRNLFIINNKMRGTKWLKKEAHNY